MTYALTLTGPDVIAIAKGDTTGVDAIWLVGSRMLGHTNDLVEIRRGAKTHGREGGAGGAGFDGFWLSYHPSKGVWIETTTWREPIDDRERKLSETLEKMGDDGLIPASTTVWSTGWAPVVALVAPIMSAPESHPLVAEVLSAARARRESTSRLHPMSHLDQRSPKQRDRDHEEWSGLEARCCAAGRAVWAAAKPEQNLLDLLAIAGDA